RMSLLFISHDLAVVRRLCERVLVLYLGTMMELARSESLYSRPRHPYARELLDAVPVADPDIQPARLREARPGHPPSPLAPPARAAERVRLPQPLPARVGDLRRARAGVGGKRRGRPRGLSSLAGARVKLGGGHIALRFPAPRKPWAHVPCAPARRCAPSPCA